MPALKKFDANVVRHVKLMNKNLCANLIRHEYIVTGRTKAKRAQAKIESFLARAMYQNKELAEQPLALRIRQVKALGYLQPPDKAELAPKVLDELSRRFSTRTHGFTRIIKLENRLGTDNAPMSVLELVDSDFEIKFWYTAKIVARLELQGLELDGITSHNVQSLTHSRHNGTARFRDAVEECKVKFFSYDPETKSVTDAAVRAELDNKPSLRYVEQAVDFSGSKRHPVKPRGQRSSVAVPPSPFLEQS
ncbi:ribosomal protein L17 [Metschnikowia bicuspidata var. bicuspidata NRRL YB-4993]|uniref:Ribosomal protein L17 n=1 Tax=Metschnikowia bicuspidata var. bicuspidata NRRL YB-4993 TaxID=869754 RepID=A0A1A0H694_9ASCO|nr:ribosomal protein L17 [Metschnikowia bicuspidata var. bicuspidata NRRL YB-4993]OBA19480.1 ribosomal protein L17 [Metschnikowia bicuspidata var. bicuspidata NRRL YB-4993]